MIETVESRLKALGIVLPVPPVPVANYVPYVRTGTQVVVSGQLPFFEGQLIKGHLGENLSVEEGRKAARCCALALLAQAKAALEGDLERITRVVQLGAFVASTPSFTEHPAVVNGASDMMVEVLGEKGKHTRFAVGVPSLPLGAAVEISAVFDVR